MGGWDEGEAGKEMHNFHQVLVSNIEINFHKKNDDYKLDYVISRLRSISYLIKAFIKYFIKHC